jgi:hypothetical protein
MVLLVRFRVAHEYFHDGLARDLQFVPDAATAALLQRFGLVERTDGHALTLHAPESALRLLFGEPAAPLSWQLRPRDGQFTLYSDDRAPPPLVLDLRPAAGQGFDAWQAGLGSTQWLHLRARRSIWKYLLVGDWQDHQLSLVDAEQQVAFRRDEPEQLSDGRQAQVFRSTRRLHLCERGTQRFELHDVGADPPRLLVPRLPLAAPRGLRCERRQGRKRPVSEIFFSR